LFYKTKQKIEQGYFPKNDMKIKLRWYVFIIFTSLSIKISIKGERYAKVKAEIIKKMFGF